MKQQTYIELFEHETQQVDQPACFSRFGRVVDFNQATNSVRINFADNPLEQPIWARLERHFEASELKLSVDNQARCWVEFVNQDLTLPVVTEIYFGVSGDGKELILSVDKLTVETSNELAIISGNAETHYRGKEGSVTTDAEHVTSKASVAQKILGGTIAIN
jgi:hypothetical protein